MLQYMRPTMLVMPLTCRVAEVPARACGITADPFYGAVLQWARRMCRYFPCGSSPRHALNRSVSRVPPTGVEGAPNNEHGAPDRVALIAGREACISGIELSGTAAVREFNQYVRPVLQQIDHRPAQVAFLRPS